MPQGCGAHIKYSVGSLKSKKGGFTAYFLLIRQIQQMSVKLEFVSLVKSLVK